MEKLIEIDEKNKVFHLHNDKISYLFEVEQGGYLGHLYFGTRVFDYHGQLHYPRVDRGFSGNLPGSLERTYSLDSLLQEYSGAGTGDYRTSALDLQNADGSFVVRLTYQGYELLAGKPKLAGLPASYATESEAQTLAISLKDEVSDVEVTLFYTIFKELAIIARSVKVTNCGQEPLTLKKVASMQLDLLQQDLEVISLPGAHANERHIQREAVGQGRKVFESRRGSSSHQMNSFIALLDQHATEFAGNVYGFNLVYSGNHSFEVEKDQFEQTRVVVGINDYNFSWQLAPGATFQTPEVLLVFSDKGLNEMSHNYHELLRKHIVRGKFKAKERPILVNNWEATYFDFNEAKLRPIVDEAKALGIEMFVLDDGWFGKRDDDNTSLGDWQVYARKFPKGLKNFADYVHAQGLQFGIWLEPEMISYDSDLYRTHPEYLMQVPKRTPSPSRNQYILDLTQKEVRQNVLKQLSELLDQGFIDYVKWDMNRNISDVYAHALPANQQGEVYHRYILGLYEILEHLTTKYPDILWEGCSGGGGRFDTGFAYYMPQSWTSDNTDALARQTIQYGTSLVYPPSVFTAHVSAVPNHQTGRITPLATRGAVAMSAVFGYELDLTKLTAEEKAAVKKQVATYKQLRPLVQFGDFIRLKDPAKQNQCAWMFVAKDKNEALVFVFDRLASAQPTHTLTKLAGLTANKHYQEQTTKEIFTGSELMNLGFYDPLHRHDFTADMYHFKAIN